MDGACIFSQDIDNSSDAQFNQLTAKDFLDQDSTVSLAGDMED